MQIRYDLILGSRRLSNYLWAIISFLGGIGFLLSGISSYLGMNLIPFTNLESIVFIPQGIVMTFYGTIGILLSLFLFLNISLDVGGGYNAYDKKSGSIKIFRLGFPGKRRKILLQYKIQEIKSIRLTIVEGINPKREIYLQTKDQRQIPLTRVGEPLLLSQIEEEAVELASFLNIPLEGL